MTDQRTELIIKSASKFNSLEVATRVQNRATKSSMIILGDDGKFWVVTCGEAAYLEKRGYTVA